MIEPSHRSLPIQFFEDAEANAASITFDDTARGRKLATFPVEDANGDVIATVTFAESGRLVQIELLNASAQVPGTLR